MRLCVESPRRRGLAQMRQGGESISSTVRGLSRTSALLRGLISRMACLAAAPVYDVLTKAYGRIKPVMQLLTAVIPFGAVPCLRRP